MNKNKKINVKRSIQGFVSFLAPYKWGFIGAILMGVVAVFTMTMAPTFEGRITTSIANDVVNSPKGNIVIDFENILRLIVILLGIYLIKRFRKCLRQYGLPMPFSMQCVICVMRC